MSELLSALNRAETLINQGEKQGAINILWVAIDHAKAAEQLLAAQTKSMTEAHLKIKELTERLSYWERRARSYESRLIELGDLPDDTLDNLRTYGLEDHLSGSDQDA